jgi:hypothetical protein
MQRALPSCFKMAATMSGRTAGSVWDNGEDDAGSSVERDGGAEPAIERRARQLWQAANRASGYSFKSSNSAGPLLTREGNGDVSSAGLLSSASLPLTSNFN